MANSISNIMVDLRLRCTNLYGVAQAAELAAQEHSQILDHVKARDVEGARRAMEKHLTHTRKAVQDVEPSVAEQNRVSSFSDSVEPRLSS